MSRSFEQSSEPSFAREIPFGESRSASLPYPSNTILTRRYSGLSFLPRSLLRLFQHCAFLWLLLVCALDAVKLAVKDQGGGEWATVAVFALAVLIALTREALVEAQREATDRHTNSVLCRVWDGQDFAEMRSGSVLCGDLLLVNNGEALVADMVLFTTEHPDGYCYVDSSQTLGSAELILKRSVSEVQRYAEASTIERLTTALPRVRGMIRTATPSQDFESFQGSLRLSRAPSAVSLSMDSFLFRGSRMYGSGWILCCVVGTGMETKVMLNSKASIESLSRLEVVLDRYCYCAVAVMVLLIVGNTVGFEVSSREWDGSVGWAVLYYISLVHRLIPAPLLLFAELIGLLQTFLANHFLKSSATVQLNPFTSAAHFGQIDYIVADKNCAFTSGSPLVHTLIYGDKLFNQCKGYPSGSHSCSESLRRNKQRAVIISDIPASLLRKTRVDDSNGCTHNSLRSKPTEDIQEPPCGFRTLETMLQSGDSEDLASCLECLVLCNTITQLEPLKARNKFEEALISFARKMGVKLLESYEDRTLLEFPNRRQIYKILAASDYSSVLERERVLVEQLGASSGKLLVKGSIETIGPLLNIEEELFDQIKSSELQLKQSGLIPILLACKIIPEEQLDLVKDMIWKAQSSIISVHQKLEALFLDLERGLRYLGVVCIEDAIGSDAAEGVSKLAISGVKLWVVSNDSEMESLATCMRAGYFDDEAYIVPVKKLSDHRDCQRRLVNLVTEFIYRKPLISSWVDEASAMLNTPRTLRVMPSLERFITNIGENTQRKNSYRDLLTSPFDPSGVNFMLMIDGISFETGLQEEETQKLLAALLFTARSVCFFNMLPHQKAKVVRFLRHSFSFSPSVLTFADGLSSIPMLNESDLKAGLMRLSSSQSSYLFDAQATSLNSLADFLVTVGRNSYRRARHTVLFILYENTVVATVMVGYTGLCGFTGVSPIDLACVCAVTTIATKPLMLYIGLWAEDIGREEAIETPQIYHWRARSLNYAVLLRKLLLAVFHGAFLSLIAFLGVNNSLTPSGYTENALTQSGSLVLMLFLAITGHLCAAVLEKAVLFWVFLLSGCCLLALEVMLFNYTYEPLVGFLDMTAAFPSLVLRLALAPCFVYATSLAVSLYSHHFQFPLFKFITSSFEISRIAQFAENITKVWSASRLWIPPKSDNAFERNRVWGTFRSHSVEENYQTSILPELIRHIQAGYCIVILTVCTVVIMAMAEGTSPEYHPARGLLVGFCILLLAATCFPFYQRHFRLVNLTCVLVLSISLGVYQALSRHNSCEVAISLPLLFFLSFPNSFGLVLLCSCANLAVFTVTGVFNVLLSADTTSHGATELIRLVANVTGVTIASGLAGYFLDDLNRAKFCLLTTKETELEKVDNVLKYLLPEFVRARVKDGVRFIAEVQPSVHIVFCELCRFDKMIKDYDAMEITSLLNNIYEKFDEICEWCGVTKVETVGKVYMACAGVKEQQQSVNPKLTNVSLAQRVLYFAFELISAMDQFRLADGGPVRIKVGIHSGKVIAGVVGSHKPQFSLVGDTVNTASRMCSTVEEENSVQMSATTYDLVKDTYGVHFDQKTKEVKGKGMMDVYVAWKDIASRNFREDIEAPDISPQTKPLPTSLALPRGFTLARRNSVFEGNIASKPPTVLKQSLLRRCFPLKLVTSKFDSEILVLRKPLAFAGLSVVCFLAVVNIALEAGNYVTGAGGWEVLIFTIVICVELAVLLVLTWFAFTQRWFSWVALVLLLLTIVNQFGAMAFAQEEAISSHFGFVVLLVLAAIHFTGMRSSQLLPFILTATVLTVIRFGWLLQSKEASLRLACILGELASFLIYVLYRDARIEKYFTLKQAVTAEIEKTDNLLQNLLPQHILDSMKLERAITDHLEETTLLVADIVGFTAWSNEREPSEVIEMLSNLFSEFDQLCLVHKAYKVYTIGDCYIAMGYWDRESQRSPGLECRNVVRMAEDMKKVIAQVNDDYFTDLNMRIGVHTGEIIGAMVGTNIVRYDIYGRDVLIAFKMEANSKPGEINLSLASRNLLEQAAPDEFLFEPNTTVDISAIGAKVPCFLTRPCP